MNKIVILFLVLLCFSCKQEKYTTESLLLENLKETSSFYEIQAKQISKAINSKQEDFGYKSGKLDTLNQITIKLDKLFIDLKSKNKEEKVTVQDKFIKEINNLNSEYKLNKLSSEKLDVLDNETLYFYLKSEYYKNQFENYTKYYSKMGTNCGFEKYSEKKEELIKLIENSDIQ